MHFTAWSSLVTVLVCPVAPALALEADGQALAFASAREGTSVFEPRVEIATLHFTIQAGDALEYDIIVPAACADRAGVEIVFSDGRRSEAARVQGFGAWNRVRIPLDRFVGAEASRCEVVARGSLADEIGFRIDDVVVTHASGEPFVAFRETTQSGSRIVRDDLRHAGVLLVDAGTGFDGVRTRTAADRIVEPWNAYDTTNLRLIDAGAPASTGPRGSMLVGPCVPMQFAAIGERACLHAAGQRLAFEPIEGGRFYTLWLAVSSEDGAPIKARAAGFGDAGERCAIDISVPATGASSESACDLGGCTLLEIPVAARAPLRGLELPDEPRLLVHAITVQWRKDGIGNSSFQLGWLAEQARAGRDLADMQRRQLWRYVRNRWLGPIFGEAGGEGDGDRALFTALVDGDMPAFEGALSAYLTEQSTRRGPLASLHVGLEQVREDRGVLHVEGGLDGESLLRSFASKAPGTALVIDGDLGELQQAPQIMSALGLQAAIVPAGPVVARWKGPDSSTVQVLSPSLVLSDSREFGDLDWRRWGRRARAGGASPEVFVAVSGTPRSRADAAAIVALFARLDSTPDVSLASAEAFLARAQEHLGAQVPDFVPGDLSAVRGVDSRARTESTSAKRRASAAVVEFVTCATLVSADGSSYPTGTIDGLRRQLESIDGQSAGSISVAIATQARSELGSVLEVIARGAQSLGQGTPIVAFNSLPWPRHALVQIDTPSATLIASDGSRCPSQLTASGTRIFALEIPPLGYEVVHALQGDSEPTGRPEAKVVVQGSTARNDEISFTIDPGTGALTSLALEPRHVEMLTSPAQFVEGEWTVESAAFVERGPLRAVARIELSSARGRATIEFVLAARSRALEVHLRTDGVRDGRTLAWRVPTSYLSMCAVAAVPFGFSLVGPLADEVPERHRLADWIARSDDEFGIAVLAGECASALVEQGAIALECIVGESPTTFALLPFSGGWRRANLEAHAREVSTPVHLLATDAHAGARGARHSFLSFTRIGPDGQASSGLQSGVVMSSLEPALDGNGWVARFNETAGNRAELSILFDRPVFAAERVDLRGVTKGSLRVEEGRVRLVMGPNRIETVRVRLRP